MQCSLASWAASGWLMPCGHTQSVVGSSCFNQRTVAAERLPFQQLDSRRFAGCNGTQYTCNSCSTTTAVLSLS